MNDDIPFRLRHIFTFKDMAVCDEAADEIERLRRVNDRFCDDVKTWRKLALAEHWLRVPDHLACDCLDKWVRGE